MDSTSLTLIKSSMPLLLQGALMTVKILLSASFLSLGLGLLFGIATCNKLRTTLLSSVLEGTTFILRAVPFYVQLLIWYFVLPDLFGIDLDAFTASFVSLGVCSSGYMAQAVRGGINAVENEQWEAAKTLGYSPYAQMRYVILPQMLKTCLPSITNKLDAMVKSTSILSSIGLLELTRMGMNIVSREMQPLTIYCTVALFYLLISAVVNTFSKYLEQRLSYVKN